MISSKQSLVGEQNLFRRRQCVSFASLGLLGAFQCAGKLISRGDVGAVRQTAMRYLAELRGQDDKAPDASSGNIRGFA